MECDLIALKFEMGGKFASPFVNNRRFSHTIAPCTQFRVRISDAVRMCSLFSEVMENKQEQKFDFFSCETKNCSIFSNGKTSIVSGCECVARNCIWPGAGTSNTWSNPQAMRTMPELNFIHGLRMANTCIFDRSTRANPFTRPTPTQSTY